MQRFLLTHYRSPGDLVVMTALARDLMLQYPGQLQLGVHTSCPSLWEHNPHVTPVNPNDQSYRKLLLDYGKGIKEQKNKTVHFLQYFHLNFTEQTGIPVKLLKPFGDLYVTDRERQLYKTTGRYWIINAGGKTDATVKVWWTEHYQDLVRRLRQHDIGVVQIGAVGKEHWHPNLQGVVNLIGKTNLRQLMALIANADGVICGVTATMHMAAALQRPCVTVAGGREAWWWEAYVRENAGFGDPAVAAQLKVPHRYLHTIGLLDCCMNCGCWKNKVSPYGKDKLVCLQPVRSPKQTVPRCMDMITPQMVETAVLSYYYDGTLPPIQNSSVSRDTAHLWSTANV